MNDPHSITMAFDKLRSGDPIAAERIWSQFFERLVAVARSEMRSSNRRVADEEDIAMGVMTSLFARAQQGRLPNIFNRDELWRFLLAGIRHDVIDHVRADKRAKRGSGNVRGDSVWDRAGGWEEIDCMLPTPVMLAELQEQMNELLSQLPDPMLKQIAIDKSSGFENAELAVRYDVSERTIERKLALIRKIWSTRAALS